jgi:hypothetical protein
MPIVAKGEDKAMPLTVLDRQLRRQEAEAPRIFIQSTYECGKVSPTHVPSLPPRKYPYSFLLDAESIPES